MASTASGSAPCSSRRSATRLAAACRTGSARHDAEASAARMSAVQPFPSTASTAHRPVASNADANWVSPRAAQAINGVLLSIPWSAWFTSAPSVSHKSAPAPSPASQHRSNAESRRPAACATSAGKLAKAAPAVRGSSPALISALTAFAKSAAPLASKVSAPKATRRASVATTNLPARSASAPCSKLGSRGAVASRCNRAATQATWPCCAAMLRGARPSGSRASGSAPAAARGATTVALPLSHARCIAVLPDGFLRVASARHTWTCPFSPLHSAPAHSATTTAAWPATAAASKAVSGWRPNLLST